MRCLCSAICMMMPAAALSGHIVWTGSETGIWDGVTTSWRDEHGNAVVFTNGDDVEFSGSAEGDTIEVSGNVQPQSILFDVAQDVTLTTVSSSENNFISGNSLLTKRGAGTLHLASKGTLNKSTNGVVVVAGRILVSGANRLNVLGDSITGFPVEIMPHAELHVQDRNVLGESSKGSGVEIKVWTNGVFSLANNPDDPSHFNVQYLKSVKLLGGRMVLPDYPWNVGAFRVSDLFAVDGTNAYLFATNRTDGYAQKMLIGSNTVFRVEDVTGDSSADLTFRLPLVFHRDWTNVASSLYGKYGRAFGFTKTGDGTMLVDYPALLTGEARSPNGDIVVEGGELCFAQPLSLDPCADRILRVEAGATLRFKGAPYVEGVNLTTNAPPIAGKMVIDHGTLILDYGSDGKGHFVFGDTVFDDATIDYSTMRSTGNPGLFSFWCKMDFRGTVPYVFDGTKSPLSPSAFVCLSSDFPAITEFRVNDITGDERVDVIIGHQINNQRDMVRYWWNPGGFVKSGAGTLAITNHLNIFTGNVDVREGTLLAGTGLGINSKTATPNNSYLGTMSEGRRFTVRNGATLWLSDRNMFGEHGAITNLSPKGTFVFEGGSLKISEGQAFVLPDMEFSGGGTVVPGVGNSSYGRFIVRENFKVSGTSPFVWNQAPDSGDMTAQGLVLNGYPENVFDIEDVTGNPEPDATFNVPFVISAAYFNKYKSWDAWSFGFIKKGAGTMRLSSSLQAHSFNGDVKVLAGTLQIDGDISRSDTIRLSPGSYLSGTGIVNNVALAEGSGLRVKAGTADPMGIRGNLSASAGVVVDVIVPADGDITEVFADVLTVDGTISGAENLATATIKVNGSPSDRLYVRLDEGRMRIRYRRGLMIRFR